MAKPPVGLAASVPALRRNDRRGEVPVSPVLGVAVVSQGAEDQNRVEGPLAHPYAVAVDLLDQEGQADSRRSSIRRIAARASAPGSLTPPRPWREASAPDLKMASR